MFGIGIKFALFSFFCGSAVYSTVPLDKTLAQNTHSLSSEFIFKLSKLATKSKRDVDPVFDQLLSCTSAYCKEVFEKATCYVVHPTEFAGLVPGIYGCSGDTIWSILFQGSCQCQSLKTLFNGTVYGMAVSENGLHWLSSDERELFTLSNSTGAINITSEKILNFNDSSADIICNIPSRPIAIPRPINIGGSSVAFNVTTPSAVNSIPICSNHTTSIQTTSLLFWEADIKHCIGNADCKSKTISNTTQADLNALKPNTEYRVQLLVSKTIENWSLAYLSAHLTVNTSCGVSSPVSGLRCSPQSYNEVRIDWSPPSVLNTASVTYQVTAGGVSSNISRNSSSFTEFTTETLDYEVRAYPVDCPLAGGAFSTAGVRCAPYEAPSELLIERVTSDTITVVWAPYPPGQVREIVVLWRLESDFGGWTPSLPQGGSATTDTITDLISGTEYLLKARVTYVSGSVAETPGSDGVLTFEGVPNAPRNATIVGATPDGFLTWMQPLPLAGGRPDVDNYYIEARNRTDPSYFRVLYGNWSLATKISSRAERIWKIANLTQFDWYEFRVYGENSIGRGDTSPVTAPYQFSLPADNSRYLWITIGSSVGTALFILVFVFAIVCYKCSIRRRRKRFRKQLPGEITTIHINYGMDMELAQIRHMTSLAMAAAANGGSINLPDDYMKRLPLFPRDKLTLDTLLGSGAFGEVYKGIAIDIKGGDAGIESPVAVKTLKDGASDGEKCEFLMEAYFMSLFDHPNIISLLGVCLDNEPQFLILELMEGGDLLKYLRQARPTQILGAKLKLVDLLDIGLDLAAGCQYLESQHFIHRDLAARNCLVSTKAFRNTDRIVKIGDFGLARDIYRNDYYHKEGEGLVPVRWMAPENLTLKIYTVQSDVWAFGVLLWEVMTFGQQPYPALTNMEVIHYVKEGGRLEKPSACPDVLYDVMSKCWDIGPESRPSFQQILQVMQDCKIDLSSGNEPRATSSSAINYSLMSPSNEDSSVFVASPTRSGIDNDAFVFDEDDQANGHAGHSGYAAVSFSSPSYQSGKFHLESATTPYTNNFIQRASSLKASIKRQASESGVAGPSDINYAQLGFLPQLSTSRMSPRSRNPIIDIVLPGQDCDIVCDASEIADLSASRNQYVRTPVHDSAFDLPRCDVPASSTQNHGDAPTSNISSRQSARSNSSRRGSKLRKLSKKKAPRRKDDVTMTRLSGKAYVNQLTRHWDDGDDESGGGSARAVTYL